MSERVWSQNDVERVVWNAMNDYFQNEIKPTIAQQERRVMEELLALRHRMAMLDGGEGLR